jgi:hypothetical protein
VEDVPSYAGHSREIRSATVIETRWGVRLNALLAVGCSHDRGSPEKHNGPATELVTRPLWSWDQSAASASGTSSSVVMRRAPFRTVGVRFRRRASTGAGKK